MAGEGEKFMHAIVFHAMSGALNLPTT